MTDVFSLKLAIYFILPPVALCVSAFIFAGLLTLIARMVVEREVSLDRAMHVMAFVIATTTGVAALVHWTTHAVWITIAAGSATFFFSGAIVYSRFIKDYSPRDRRASVAPIGPVKGLQISAALSLFVVAFTLCVLWCAGIAR